MVAHPQNQFINAVGNHGVQTRGGLVIKDNLRFINDGAREADALRMPPESSDGPFVLGPRQFHDIEARATLSLMASSGNFSRRSAKATFSATVIESKSAGTLEEHAEFATQRAQLPLIQTAKVLAVNQDLAGIRGQERDQMFEQDAFAAAATPDNGNGFAIFQRGKLTSSRMT